MALSWLLGNSQRLGDIDSRSTVGAGTLDRDVDRPQMVNAQRIDTILGIPRLRRFGRRRLTQRQCVAWSRRDTLDGDDVYDRRRSIRTEIVQIEVDVVVVLTDDTARQFAVVQDERVAGVIRQGDAPFGCCLLVQIGIRGVGYQLVPHAGHKEVARRYLGILLVELVDLLLEVTPLLGALRLLHLHGNALCQVIVEFERNGNGGIAARLLEIAVVFHPLAITLVHRIVLLVKLVVEVAPGGILVFITACIHVVDHYDLRAVDDFLSCGNAQGAVDDLTEHIRPNGLEMGSRCPVATAIAINDLRVGLCEALAAVRPRQFRTIPDGTAVDARLFHHRTDAGSTRILTLAFALQVAHGTFPTAVVVAHAIVLGQPGDERSNGHTLVVVETARRGVLI